MKKTESLSIFLLSLFLYNCSSVINVSDSSTNSNINQNQPSSIFNSVNKTNPESESSPSCSNNNVVTLNVYSNKANEYSISNSYTYLSNYISISKNESPLQGVEVSYDNQKLLTDKEGRVNLPKKDSYNLKLSKNGYLPYETTVENSCFTYIGLSPLYSEELNTKMLNFKSYHASPSENRDKYPEFFIKDAKTNFAYFIIRNKTDFEKVKLLDIYLEDANAVEKSITEKKNMFALFIESDYTLGSRPEPFDSAYESDKNIILSNHKNINLNVIPTSPLPPPVIGDRFAISIQGVYLPYTDKKIKFMTSESLTLEEK